MLPVASTPAARSIVRAITSHHPQRLGSHRPSTNTGFPEPSVWLRERTGLWRINGRSGESGEARAGRALAKASTPTGGCTSTNRAPQSTIVGHRYTPDEKTHAVTLVLEHGMAEAHDRTGIPKPTLSRWLTPDQHAELAERFGAKTAAATRAHVQSLEVRRHQLAADLMSDVERLRRQLFAPCVERKAMVVSQGSELGSEVEVVDIELTQPTFRDQQTILTTVAIGIDKIQVLTGQPSEITGHVEVPERSPDQESELAAVVELAQRRAA